MRFFLKSFLIKGWKSTLPAIVLEITVKKRNVVHTYISVHLYRKEFTLIYSIFWELPDFVGF